ncbi:MAG: abortive infection family protein [Campylobacteraceae bacterium]|jgi:hypothetical protein|nr:abortive infection family protein [Campylobacteraceae bacterium]
MDIKTKNYYELLRNRKIINILDGDIEFGEFSLPESNSPIKLSMPYLSGSVICDISNNFGLAVSYGWNSGAKSRWIYLDDLLAHCIKNGRESDLLAFLFSKKQFVDKLRGYIPISIEVAHRKIIETVVSQINGILYFGGYELYTAEQRFLIRKTDVAITVAAPVVKKIDRDYIRSISERAIEDIANSNYDSAITKTRTLLEEVFCYVIESKNEKPNDSGNIGKLYNQVKTLYGMHQDKNMDNRINMLLSGLEKIVSTIAQMRNGGSDSHGLGIKRINIDEYHARLFVNSAITMADFILAVGDKSA